MMKINQNLIRWFKGQGKQLFQKWKKLKKVVQKLSHEQGSAAGGDAGGSVQTGTKT